MPEIDAVEVVTGDVPAQVLARVLNLSVSRIYGLAKEGIIIKSGRGAYNFVASIRGYVTFLQTSDEMAVTDPDKLKPFDRRAWYQAELDKLELRRKEGELVAAMEAEVVYADGMKMIAQRLETQVDRVEREVGLSPEQAECMQQLNDELREAIFESIQKASFTGEDDDDAVAKSG